MTVKITKPASITQSDVNALNRGVGVAGNRIGAYEAKDSVFRLISAGRKNLIINGAMNLAQRGTSESAISTDGYYTADRWRIEGTTTGDIDMAVETSDTPSGFGSLLKLSRSSSQTLDAGDFLALVQKVEGNKLQELEYGSDAPKDLTISFWVKTNVPGQYVINLYTEDTGQNRIITKPYYVQSSDVWEKHSITFPGDDYGTLNNDTGVGMYVQFCLRAGTDKTTGTPCDKEWVSFSNTRYFAGQRADLTYGSGGFFKITGIQMEVGSVATPYEYLSYDQELHDCQRYFEKSCQPGVILTQGSTTTTFGTADTTKLCQLAIWSHPTLIPFTVEKRAIPTVTKYGNSQGYWAYLSAGLSGPSGISTPTFHQNVLSTGATTKYISVNNQVSTSPLWGLFGNWTADAEL